MHVQTCSMEPSRQSLILTRDSVAMGDDVYAPHLHRARVLGDTPLELVNAVLQLGYLPKIAGGKAVWVASSNEPIAVCAQEWADARQIPSICDLSIMKRSGEAIRLHFSYLVQASADDVLENLRRLTFVAPEV